MAEYYVTFKRWGKWYFHIHPDEARLTKGKQTLAGPFKTELEAEAMKLNFLQQFIDYAKEHPEKIRD